MNPNQEKILELAKKKDISKMAFREIGRKLGIKNPQTVKYHLESLKNRGLIYHDPKVNKTVISKPMAYGIDRLFSLPILGSANCGEALELAQENIQGYLRVSSTLVKKKDPKGLIVIKAVGRSLDEAKDILGGPVDSGDYVIVDCNNKAPNNGDYVLSVIDVGANIKRFYQDKDEIRLVSESSLNISPIVLHEKDLQTSKYLVNGVVIRVIKR